jgi:hypothetical protein
MILTLSAALLLAVSAASAQQQDRAGVPDKDQRPPTLMPLPDQGEGSGSSLTDRLSKSGGVIKPPADPDPEMKQPTPPDGAQLDAGRPAARHARRRPDRQA